MSGASARNCFGYPTVSDIAAAFTATAQADERLVRAGCDLADRRPTSYALTADA